MEKVSYFQIWGTYLPPKSPKKVLRNMWMVPYTRDISKEEQLKILKQPRAPGTKITTDVLLF